MTHPVLARLPDVSGQRAAQPGSGRAAAAGFVDYRFDMPAGIEVAEPRPRLRVQPPAFRRSPRSDHRSRPLGGPSRALPDADPFALPVTSMLDRLAPVIRFLTLFLLFTAIGTFVLSTTRERSSQPKLEHAPSAAAPAGVEQKLEPTTNDDHPTIATPKAFGPLGANFHEPVIETSQPVEIESKSTASAPTASSESLPSLAGADGGPLPQVQTTEVAAAPEELTGDAAPARLTGRIQSNDDAPTEKRAKRPAVARRLPAIFDAPRNAYQ